MKFWVRFSSISTATFSTNPLYLNSLCSLSLLTSCPPHNTLLFPLPPPSPEKGTEVGLGESKVVEVNSSDHKWPSQLHIPIWCTSLPQYLFQLKLSVIQGTASNHPFFFLPFLLSFPSLPACSQIHIYRHL